MIPPDEVVVRFLPFVFVGVPIMCYSAQAALYYVGENRIGLALTMACYALANVGVIVDFFEMQVRKP